MEIRKKLSLGMGMETIPLCIIVIVLNILLLNLSALLMNLTRVGPK